MRSLLKLFFLLSLTFAIGCNTFRIPIDQNRVMDRRTFRLRIDSDPSGAEIFWPSKNGLRSIGVTPKVIEFQFEKKPDDNVLGYLGLSVWQAAQNSKTSQLIRRQGDSFILEIPEITLQKKGYEPEQFSCNWDVPANFKKRTVRGDQVPVATERNETVVMRSPSSPQLIHKINIESASGPGEIHRIDDSGQLGSRVGTTPMSSKLGFAPIRSKSGEIVNWKHWDLDEHGIWSHTKDGKLFFNGYLVKEGYKNEKFVKYPVLPTVDSEEIEHNLVLRMTRPTEPESKFELNVDSLPTNSVVYHLRQDGSLGSKIEETPFAVEIGLAQQLKRDGNQYRHSDWLIWASKEFVDWVTDPNGTTTLYLKCAIYKEGYATENVVQAIMQLTPGKPFPVSKTLTIPLLRPEEAAARREASRSRPSQSIETNKSEKQESKRRTFIWKESGK